MADCSQPRVPCAGSVLGGLLATVAPETRAWLTARLCERVVPAGTVLACPGTDLTEVAEVLEGTLGLMQRAANGRAHLIGVLMARDICGHPYESPATCRIEALSDARLLTIPRADLEAVIEQDPEADQQLGAHLLAVMDRTGDWLQVIGRRRVTERVAAFVMILARRSETAGPLRLPLTRAQLALHLGTRPETLSRSLHELGTRGAIRLLDPYQLCVTDAPLLAQIAG